MNKLQALVAKLEEIAASPPKLSVDSYKANRPVRRVSGPNSRGQRRPSMRTPTTNVEGAKQRAVDEARRDLARQIKERFQ